MQENEVGSKHYHLTVIFLAIGHLKKNIFVNNQALYTSKKHIEKKKLHKNELPLVY